MRACLALLSVATPIVLTGCMPIMDIELYNDTGQDIVVSGIAGAEKTVSIPQRKSKPLDLLTIQQGQPEKLAVMTPTASWFYPHCQKLFGSVRAPFWKERAFNAQRAFGRIDSRGRIYMLLPPQDGHSPQSPAQQPAGFPLKPQ